MWRWPADGSRRRRAMRIDCEVENPGGMPADSIRCCRKEGTSARPADSSTMRLHQSRKYAEGGYGSSCAGFRTPAATALIYADDVERVLANIEASYGDCGVEFR